MGESLMGDGRNELCLWDLDICVVREKEKKHFLSLDYTQFRAVYDRNQASYDFSHALTEPLITSEHRVRHPRSPSDYNLTPGIYSFSCSQSRTIGNKPHVLSFPPHVYSSLSKKVQVAE